MGRIYTCNTSFTDSLLHYKKFVTYPSDAQRAELSTTKLR